MAESPSDRLIATLLREPKRFGPDTPDVQLLQTHISWVLLAGKYAWKFKKPVNFGFLDFSTLERRRFFCEEELRLNRRLAPQLYLDVVAWTGTPESPELNGDGPPIEFAVKMARFEQERLLTHVLKSGHLRREQIDDLAIQVADFHASLAAAPPETAFGTPEAVFQPVQESLERLGPEADELARWFDGEYVRCEAAFRERRDRGFIRECHGDMHLGNMILDANDRILLFDGIEFSASLRWIDVASEIAFVTMDLADRGRPDLAHRLLNAYLERTGDYDLLRVLRFYQVYRAVVRAKVALLRQQQTPSGSSESEALRREQGVYLELANRCTRSGPPVLLITHGLSGSGKTTGTQPIVEKHGAIRLRSDVERKRLHGLVGTARSGSAIDAGLYTAEASRETYQRLKELARGILRTGRMAIVDATFLKRADRNAFHELAREESAHFAILDFQAPVELLRERVRKRQFEQRDASEATLAVLENQLLRQEPLAPEELALCLSPHHALETDPNAWPMH